MKFINYLSEVRQLSLFPELEPDFKFELNKNIIYSRKTIDLVSRECSDIISLLKKSRNLLWRGMSTSEKREIGPHTYRVIPRNYRQPKDTNEYSSQLIDDFFYKKFKWKPRSEGVFATPSPATAASYNTHHLFLPANGFKYLWSPQYADLYTDFFETDFESIYNTHESEGYWEEKGNKGKGPTFPRLYRIKYKNQTYEKIVHSDDINNETTLLFIDPDTWENVEKTYVFTPNQTQQEWEKERDNVLMDVVKTYKDTGLSTVLNSTGFDKKNREIMFKCSHYFAIYTGTSYSDLIDTSIEDFGF